MVEGTAETGTPLFFGEERALFGCLHAPAADPRPWGVVICPPFGPEELLAHGALRTLGLRLVAAGFPVLRFDYFGCGDSQGDFEEGRLATWTDDVTRAVTELRSREHLATICLVGARLGASLAALAGAELERVEPGGVAAWIGWDPVRRGAEHLAELRALQRKMLATAHVRARRGSEVEEVLGYPLTPRLVEDLESLDLSTLAHRPAERAFVVDTTQDPAPEKVWPHLGLSVEHRSVPIPDLWTWREDLARLRAPLAAIDAVASWIAEAAP